MKSWLRNSPPTFPSLNPQVTLFSRSSEANMPITAFISDGIINVRSATTLSVISLLGC